MQHADETAAAARCMLSDARKAHLVKARRHHEAGIPRNYRQRRRDIYEECADVDCVGSRLYDSHLFLGLQSRQSVVAQARYRHRSVLLVLHSGRRTFLRL